MKVLAVVFALIAVSILTRDQAKRVALVEINHVYNSDGEKRFTQLIVWDRQRGSKAYHVRAWMMKDRLVSLTKRSNKWEVVYAGKDGVLVTVLANSHRISHTEHDPEELDRVDFPIDLRIPLE